jgi:hypothetical protein
MKFSLTKIDKAWTALTLIAAIFVAGAVAAIDYWELRDTVTDLDKKEASRTYWRIKAKMEKKRADIYELSEWCEAAHKLGYECQTGNIQPHSLLIKPAFAGGPMPIEKEDYFFFRETHNRYLYWRDVLKRPGQFKVSRDAYVDREAKTRYCAIGLRLHTDLMVRVPRQMRRNYRCPPEFKRW